MEDGQSHPDDSPDTADHSDQRWWSEVRFRGENAISRWLNRLLTRECDTLQSAFEERIRSRVDERTARLIRRDASKMTRWTALEEAAIELAQETYALVRDILVWVVPGVLAAAEVSRGPGWLEALLIAAVVLFLAAAYIDSESMRSETQSLVDGLLLFCLLTAGGSIVALVARPENGLSVLDGIVVVMLAVITAFIIGRIAHAVVAADAQNYLVTNFILMAFAAGPVMLWRYVPLGGLPDFLRLGLSTGALTGYGAAIALAAIESGYQTIKGVLAYRKYKDPEAEFVQSALYAIIEAERAMQADADENNRASTVRAFEYCARLLDTRIRSVLLYQDRRSTEVITERLSRRAEWIRMHKRALLLGKPGAYAKAVRAMTTAVVEGGRRNWLALPSADSAEGAVEPWRQRLLRLVTNFLAVTVPLAAVAVTWLLGHTTLLPFAALWALLSLMEMMRPGSAEELAKSASSAQTISSPFHHRGGQ